MRDRGPEKKACKKGRGLSRNHNKHAARAESKSARAYGKKALKEYG
jgi:hypothetical protein